METSSDPRDVGWHPGPRRYAPDRWASGIRGGHRQRRNSVVMAESLRQASDAALVVAIGRWRQDALAEAYRRHAGAVFALARRLLVDPGMAEEIVQEIFLRLWNQPDKFDPEWG